ncbi:MAG TPA: MFS transporter [Candidatus Binatia bacterium]
MLLSPLRHRDYRVFCGGLLLSSVGSQFTTVAIAWQIYELTNSPLQLGFMGLARGVPQVAMLLFGGLLADALNRRKVILCTQSILLVVSAALAFSTFTEKTTPPTLYAATVALALFSSLEAPARHSIVSNLVPREDLAAALAIYNSQRHVATIAGPAVAGVIIAAWGPAICYAIDAVSWLIMFVSVLSIRTPLPEGEGRRAVSFESLRAGFNFVLNHAVIFPLLIMDFGANIFGTVRALLPIYAKDILSVGPRGLGILYAASAFGSLTGAIGLSFIESARRAGAWILAGVTVYAISIVLFATSHVFWFSVFLLAVSGIGDTISAIMRSTINQLATPDEMRGRMSSINSLFTNCGPQLGQFEAGALAALVGAELATMSGGWAILLIVALLVFRFPHVRHYQIAGDDR